ncbi:MAG: hypothetical protein Kow0080_08510 [Candidatus Promineifilaceae bacterium]
MRILLAVDGSPYSDVAVEMAVEWANLVQTSITVLTVTRQAEMTVSRVEIVDKVVLRLETAVSPSRKPQITSRIISGHIGHPAKAILQEIATHPYDMVIMGKRPSSDWRAKLMGPTTQQIIAHANIPVLIAKGHSSLLRHILLCDSGITDPPLLTRFLTAIPAAIIRQIDVTVLHVMSQISAGPGIPGKQLRATAEELMAGDTPEGELLRRDARLLAEAGIPKRLVLRHGLVLDEILAEAQTGAFDLLVIGAHRKHGIPAILLEDQAWLILKEVNRPVLILP